jgi:hypothetical protein
VEGEVIMGFIDRLLGRRREEPEGPSVEECVHEDIVAHWDQASLMGREDAISYYLCSACGAHLSPEEAHTLRAERIQRLREPVSPGP